MGIPKGTGDPSALATLQRIHIRAAAEEQLEKAQSGDNDGAYERMLANNDRYEALQQAITTLSRPGRT